MIVAEIARALELYYAKALDDGGRPVGSHARYVGGTLWSCCDAGFDGQVLGTLRVSMAGIGPSTNPPNRTIVWGTCAVTPIIEWTVRVARCWPSDENTTPDVFDGHAEGIEDDAWILAGSTTALLNNTGLLDVYCDGSLGCKLGGYTIVPILPQGGCAGNALTLFSTAHGPYSITTS